MLCIEAILERARTRADSRHAEVMYSAIESAKKVHRSGNPGCMCNYCRFLPGYISYKRYAEEAEETFLDSRAVEQVEELRDKYKSHLMELYNE